MTETFATIATWANETFGRQRSSLSQLARANRELAELIAACADDKPLPSIAEEAADVAICLARLVAPSLDLDRDPSPAGFHSPMSLTTATLWAMQQALDGRMPPATAADVMVARLSQIATLCGTTLGDAVDAKMVVNRRREWKLDGNGHGQHVRQVL